MSSNLYRKLSRKLPGLIVLLAMCFFLFPACSKDAPKKEGNTISSFQIEIDNSIYEGMINNENGKITLNYNGILPSSIIPHVQYAEGATVSPDENAPQDFNKIVRYTVTAENGFKKVYTVVVVNSSESVSNNAPGRMEFLGVQFEGRQMKIDWTDAADTDDITYIVYKNSEEVGEFSASEALLPFTYNQTEYLTIFATDKKGGTSKLEVTVESPVSELVLITNFSGVMTAIDVREEDILWVGRDQARNNSPRIMDGKVITMLPDKITSLNLLDGTIESDLANPSLAVNFASDDSAYYFGLNRYIQAYSRVDNKNLWSTYLDYYASIKTPLVLDDQQVYAIDASADAIKALNKNSGEVNWSMDINGVSYANASPLLVGQNIYVGNSKKLYCLRKASGELIWEYDTLDANNHIMGIAYGDDLIVIVSGRTITALDVQTGIPRWKEPLPAFVSSSPFIYDGKIFAGEHGNGTGSLMSLNLETGKLIWRRQLANTIYDSPVVADGNVYLADGDGYLYCVDAQSGTIKWRIIVGGHVRTSPTYVKGNADTIIYPETQYYSEYD